MITLHINGVFAFAVCGLRYVRVSALWPRTHCAAVLTVLAVLTDCVCLQRFQRMPKRKFGGDEGDDRFAKVNTDKRFSTKVGRAKFGRPASPSTSSSSSSDDDDDDEDDLLAAAGPLGREREPVPTGEESCRLAVMNCDWDHITSVDIIFILQVM